MTDDDTKRQAVIAGLRALADFLETHPDLPTPTVKATAIWSNGTYEEQVYLVEKAAAILGVSTYDDGDHLNAERSFEDPPAPYGRGVKYKTWATAPGVMDRYYAEQSYAGSVTPDRWTSEAVDGPNPLA